MTMSGYKTILASLSDPESAPATLQLAFLVARGQGAHVEALHVRSDPSSAVPLVGEGMSGAMVEEMLAVAERQSSEQASQVRAQFDQACLRHDVPILAVPGGSTTVSTVWRQEIGREEEVVAKAGRLTDLVVMARPLPDRDQPSIMTLNAALMESGRPLLLAPPNIAATVGRHVAIFWNGSAEASRAVASSMPLLSVAETVSILSASEEGGADPTELAGYLAWHGITAVIHSYSANGQVGETLMAEALALGADLLVMGAYTHSRLRQLILGGVTRHILQSCTLPVLLSH
jgi:nucleotide-binding universal stress UspA family protein